MVVAIGKPRDLILQTALVNIEGPKGKRKVRVLLDGGAHHSYITDSAAAALGLKQFGTEQQHVNVFGGGVEVIYMKKVQLNLIGREGTVQISCLQLPKICGPSGKIE